MVGLVILHLLFLHENGSTAPLTSRDSDKIFFYPYFYIKDMLGFFIILLFYFFIVTQEPNILGHPDNYIEANPLVTPSHIVPE
jgi:ubiquinol-cytochrome c reductase cytochrome b subunit